MTNLTVNKKVEKQKKKFTDSQFHNILRLFHVLPNSPITTNETMCDYYLKTWYIEAASRVTKQLRILKN